jgi:hypothetical protein
MRMHGLITRVSFLPCSWGNAGMQAKAGWSQRALKRAFTPMV